MLKALVALAISSSAAAASSSMPSRASGAAARFATPATAAAPASCNRWVSKALATRGGADEPEAAGAGEAEGNPGVLSEVQIAMSSFSEIAGENLLVVDNAKKGTTKEVSKTAHEKKQRGAGQQPCRHAHARWVNLWPCHEGIRCVRCCCVGRGARCCWRRCCCCCFCCVVLLRRCCSCC